MKLTKLVSMTATVLLAATRAGQGVAVLPWYVAHESVKGGAVQPLLERWSLPAQEIHAVFPSPKLLPSKVRSLCDFLAPQFGERWWVGA